MSKTCTLARKRGIIGRKGRLYSKGRQGGEGGQAKGISSAEVGKSMSGGVDAKALQEDLESLGFTPSLANSEMGKKVGRQRARS